MTITNPNREIAARQAWQEAMEDPDFLDKRGRIAVKRLTKYDDPNKFDQSTRTWCARSRPPSSTSMRS